MMKLWILRIFFVKVFSGLILFIFFTNSVLAATWFVDTYADTDPNTCVADEQDNDDDCTFRDAVSQAANYDTINFLEQNLLITTFDTNTTVYTISQSGLVIDGTNKDPSFDGGSNGGSSAYSYFKVTGDNVIIKNLDIYDYRGSAIEVNGDNANINNNNLGVQRNGTTVEEIYYGVTVNTAANTIVDTNLIAGASVAGIWVRNGTGTVDTRIIGNNIGVSSSGTDMNNAGYGVLLETGTMDGGDGGIEGVVIGGSAGSARNYISGNENPGIGIVGTATVNGTVTVQNNYIGVTPNGISALGNAGSALEARKAGVWVDEAVGTGLTLNVADNVISGNSGDGIKIDSGGTVNIYGNDIGFTSGGSQLANQGDGIQADAQTLTVGTNLDGTNDANEENNIGNNTGNGIFITGDDTVTANVRGNFIGVLEGNVNSTFANGGDGINVALTGSGNGTVNIGAVGVTSVGDGRNIIGGNTGDGVDVDTFTTGSSSAMTIINNWIGRNGIYYAAAANSGVGINYDTTSGSASLRIGSDGNGTGDSGEGNVITNSGGDGIYIGDGVTSLTIAGNAIGIAPDISENANGTGGGNTGDGIEVDGTSFSSQITIGGDATAEANFIGVNGGAGVKITDAGTTAQNVRVERNNIGIGEDGTTALGNTSFGVSIGEAAAISLVNNVISNNSTYGVNITGGTTLTVTGNKIGTTAAGTAAAANVSYGIYIAAAGMTTANIGAADGRNIIAGTTATTVPGDGVYVANMADSSTITLKNNYIGTDGATDLGNVDDGIEIADTTGSITVNIGGTGTTEGNVISGNNDDGVVFSGTATITGNLYANYIGLNAAGTGALANAGNGVSVENASGVILTVGGNTAAARNVISGNTGDGINIADMATGATARLYGNYIGLNAAGTAAVANGDDGFEFADSAGSFTVMVGDISDGYGNVISGNTDDGVVLGGAATISGYLYGNYIGLNAAGTAAVANGGAGVDAANINLTLTVGNGASTGRNVISGNTGPGLDLTSGNLTVRGNYIGTNATAAAVLGNGSGAYATGVAFGGILMRSGTMTLGGSTSGQENVISGNYGQGLMVLSDTALSIISNFFGTNSAGTDLGNQAASGITYDLVSGTTEDSALNGTGILFYNNGSATIHNPIVTGNVIGSNDGAAVAVIGTSGGGGQTWTSGYFKNNYFGSLADQTAAANGATFEFYANRNSGSMTAFSVGSSTTSEKNYIKNSSSRLGFKLVDVTSSHLSGNGIADFYNNNTFAYSTCPDQQFLQVISGASQSSTVCTTAPTTTTATSTSSGAGGSSSSARSSSAASDSSRTTSSNTNSNTSDQNNSVNNETAKEEIAKEETKERQKEETERNSEKETKQEPEIRLQPKPQPKVETVEEQQKASEDNDAEATPVHLPDAEIESLIQDLETGAEEEAGAEEDADALLESKPEVAVVREAVSTGMQNLDEEKRQEVRKVVDTVVRDSLREKIVKSEVILNVGGQQRVVKDAEEADKVVEEVLNDILEGKDTDANGMPELLEISFVGTVLEDNADEDEFGLADEYAFRLDPLKKDELPEKPRAILPSEKDQVAKVGRKPVIKLLGQRNEEVEVVLVSAEKKRVSFDFADYLFSSVFGSDEEEEVAYEQVSLGKIKLDEAGKAAFGPETDLPEGKYYVVAKGKNGISEEISMIEIDHEQEIDSPEISWSGRTLKGKAQPGSIVYITWKSLILSSVVIADASQGEFEVVVPEALPQGDHEVLVFAYDPSRSLVGNLANLIFDI